jgi:hypothetical protein
LDGIGAWRRRLLRRASHSKMVTSFGVSYIFRQID